MIYTLFKLGISPWSIDPMLQGILLDYYFSRFLSWEEFINFLTFAGPMWFLMVLLIFTAVYTLWRQIVKLNSVKRITRKVFFFPKYFHLLLLAIGLEFLTFLIRIAFPIDVRPLGIPWGQLIQYLMMFSIGYICVRYFWFEKMSKKHVKIWLITILISIVLIYSDLLFALEMDIDINLFSGGANLHAFYFALGDTVICMGVIFVLIKNFYAKFNKQGPILRNLSASAYHMYLVHPPILVAISLGFAFLVLYPIIKVAIVFPLTIFLCYLVSHFILKKIHLRKTHKNNS